MDLLVRIGTRLGEHPSTTDTVPFLRKGNCIRTIHASLAIENNTLNLEQVTALFDGKRVIGSRHEIQEVENAIATYQNRDNFSPNSLADLTKAHLFLMEGLINDAGKFRSTPVGIMRGQEIVHTAPPSENVPHLIKQLFEWLNNSEIHPLISSTIFHYELEFIHPFTDGNGRMGRFWQSLILHHWDPIFSNLPVETLIHNNQESYYRILGLCDRAGDSTLFIEWMLSTILHALELQSGGASDGATGGVNEKASDTDELVLACIKKAHIPPRIPHIAESLHRSKRTIERSVQRLKKRQLVSFHGATRTGGYIFLGEQP